MVRLNFPIIAFIVVMLMQLINFLVARFYSAKTQAEVSTKNAIILGLFLGGLTVTMIVMIYIVYFKLNKIDEIVKNLETLK